MSQKAYSTIATWLLGDSDMALEQNVTDIDKSENSLSNHQSVLEPDHRVKVDPVDFGPGGRFHCESASVCTSRPRAAATDFP